MEYSLLKYASWTVGIHTFDGNTMFVVMVFQFSAPEDRLCACVLVFMGLGGWVGEGAVRWGLE